MSLKDKIMALIGSHPSVAPVVDIQLTPQVDTIITFNPLEGTFLIAIDGARVTYFKETSESITIGTNSFLNDTIVIKGYNNSIETISDNALYIEYHEGGSMYSFDSNEWITGIPSEITINATPYEESGGEDTSK